MKQYFNTIICVIALFVATPILSIAQDFNCLDCHENLIANTAHDRVVKCGDCHRDVIDEAHIEANAHDVNCSVCHKKIAEQVQTDIHHKEKNNIEGKLPTCKSCHGTHNIKATDIIEDKSIAFCGKCHKDNMLSAPYHTLNEVNESCNECHEENFDEQLSGSVHNKLSCSNCHGYVIRNIDDHAERPEDGKMADCYLCHNAVALDHKESIHGLSIAEGVKEAAQCWDCHGSHEITKTSSANSMVYPTNLVATCGVCHDDLKFIRDHDFAVKQPGKMYSQSVHGILVEEGSVDAATCITCHGVHDIKNRVQIGSKISAIGIPETCSECHKEIVDEYKKSIHWIGVKKGIGGSPSCNDCHSEHSIHAINTANKREEIKKIQEQTCLECHENLLLSTRYGLEQASAKSYEDSYHGLAVSRGDDDAALCIDCHGVHKILPKYHEESTISKENVTATCQACHAGASEIFSQSYSHVTDVDSQAHYVENIVGTVYFWLIVIVIGGMALHNLLIFFYDIRARRKERNKHIKIPRFNTNELIQHIILVLSFGILAITGFQLKYPNSWWSIGLTEMGLDEVARQYTHRVSAVVMIVLSAWHFFYLIVTRRGRSVLRTIFPRFKDITEAIQTVLYYLRLRKKHPEYDNYNYAEKAEYWALIWGTLVMGATGFILWFPTVVGDWAPLWTIKVCEIVHFYEAILATLAIIVWHWFFVIFRPTEYPLSFTCIDGKMTIVHFKDEHKMRFKKILVEWIEMKLGTRSPKKVSHLTLVFFEAVEKHGHKPEEFIRHEIETDESIKNLLIEKDLLDDFERLFEGDLVDY